MRFLLPLAVLLCLFCAGATPEHAANGEACCKTCKSSCPCGDSCISCSKECHQPPGCACYAGEGGCG